MGVFDARVWWYTGCAVFLLRLWWDEGVDVHEFCVTGFRPLIDLMVYDYCSGGPQNALLREVVLSFTTVSNILGYTYLQASSMEREAIDKRISYTKSTIARLERAYP